MRRRFGFASECVGLLLTAATTPLALVRLFLCGWG